MYKKILLAVILASQILIVFRVTGQKHEIDLIDFDDSIKDKRSFQLLPAQPSLQIRTHELWFGDYDFPGTPINKRIADFNFKHSIKYFDSLSGDSLSMILPVYPGLGDYHNFGGTLGNINMTNNLMLDYGAFISAQYGYLFSTKQIVFGGNFLLQYTITDKLQFRTWGQYVTDGNSSDPTFRMRTFFPTSNVGAGVQYNSSEKSKIRVGIEYQYDQRNKTWKPESGGKVFLNF